MLTTIIGQQIRAGTICRSNLNTSVSGCSLLTKILVPATNPGIEIVSSTGADAGTGDVTIDLNYTYINTLYATQAWVVAQHYLTSYTETDPVFTASAAHGISSANITTWNTAYNKYPTGLSVSGTSTKTVTLTLNDSSTISASFTDLTGSGSSGTPTLDQVASAGNRTASVITVGGLISTNLPNGSVNNQYLSTDPTGTLQLMSMQWLQDSSLGFSRLSPTVAGIMDLRSRGILESAYIPTTSPGSVYTVTDRDYAIVNIIPGLSLGVCLPTASKYPGRVMKLRAAAKTTGIVFTDITGNMANVVVLQVQSVGVYQFINGLSDPGGAFSNEWIEVISADLSGAGNYYWLVTQYK